MRTIIIVVTLFFALCAQAQSDSIRKVTCINGQFAIEQVGNVVYSIYPDVINTNSIVMRRRIATMVNDYVQKKNKKFPLIELRMIEQSLENHYGEKINIYFVEGKDVFFPQNPDFGIQNKSYFVISMALYDRLEENGLNAIQYVVTNSSKIKRKSKKIARRINKGIETDEDMESLTFPKI